MKHIIVFVASVLGCQCSMAQKDLKPTTSFTVSGEVKAPVTVQVGDLKKWTARNIGDVAITNHMGEKKSDAKGLKGVLLKDVLQSVEINAPSPKVLSEYYFVCKANDGYIVVYSWNELFNTAIGNTAFIVTEKDGRPATEMSDAILMISPADLRTGRRYVKALASIEVKRAQ